MNQGNNKRNFFKISETTAILTKKTKCPGVGKMFSWKFRKLLWENEKKNVTNNLFNFFSTNFHHENLFSANTPRAIHFISSQKTGPCETWKTTKKPTHLARIFESSSQTSPATRNLSISTNQPITRPSPPKAFFQAAQLSWTNESAALTPLLTSNSTPSPPQEDDTPHNYKRPLFNFWIIQTLIANWRYSHALRIMDISCYRLGNTESLRAAGRARSRKFREIDKKKTRRVLVWIGRNSNARTIRDQLKFITL